MSRERIRTTRRAQAAVAGLGVVGALGTATAIGMTASTAASTPPPTGQHKARDRSGDDAFKNWQAANNPSDDGGGDDNQQQSTQPAPQPQPAPPPPPSGGGGGGSSATTSGS